MTRQTSGALGIFSDLQQTVEAIHELPKRGFPNFIVQSPIPDHELLEAIASKKSPVRRWTLAGGILGCLSGFALTIGTSLDWPMQTSAKPIVSLPPFIVIAFELTILFGAIATLAGFLFHSRLPRFSSDVVYDPRFSEGHFGIFIECDASRATLATRTLEELGAGEVRCE